MAETKLGSPQIRVLSVTNLSAVTTATDGSAVDLRWYKDKTVFVNVSVNTGAVTVKVEVSDDGSDWYERYSKTYTATTGKDIFTLSNYYAYVRTTTTTQSNSTVTTKIIGRS